MGLFKKLISAVKSKKSIAKQIEDINNDQSLIKQMKFDEGLKKTSVGLKSQIDEIVSMKYVVDDDLVEKIEEFLIAQDIGTKSTQKILDAIVDEIKFQKVNSPELIRQIIVDKLFVYYINNTDVDTELSIKENEINVILVTGVNGVGKTTSIAKLANKLTVENKKVMLVAADTFRAGAVEQLSYWASQINVSIHKPKTEGQDPASVIFEGLQKAQTGNYDVVICDTSGRLQNKVNLMNELKKINGVIKKFSLNQPCESLLVIDATSGQSGIQQALAFNDVSKLSGIILTKMDSSSRGGIALAIKDAFNIPIKLIGLGEKVTDIETFDLERFITSLTKDVLSEER